jgi:hypothetical protein
MSGANTPNQDEDPDDFYKMDTNSGIYTSALSSLTNTAVINATTAATTGSIFGGGSTFSSIGTYANNYQTSGTVFHTQSKKEIVRLSENGDVIWADGVNIDEAADAMARAMTIGSEMAAGITNTVKLKMRDSVFEDLINIAKEKGPLNADDLTYLLSASKIVEKLKGPKD